MLEDEEVHELMTYIGDRLTANGKLAPHFMKSTGNVITFVKMRRVPYAVGTTVRVPAYEDGYAVGKMRPTGSHADKDAVREWELRDGAARAEKAIERAAKRDGELIDRHLKFLVEGLARLPAPERHAARCYILSKLIGKS